jgi:hypothetical protein
MTSPNASTLTEGRDLMGELQIRRDPPRPFLCLGGVIRQDNISIVMNSLIERFAVAAAGLAGLGPQVALYHPQGRDPFGADGEPCWLGRELTAPLDAPAGLLLNWTPGGAIATLIHHGAYEQMLQTHFALHRAVTLIGRKLIGPNWERYEPGNDPSGHPSELRTEVCYLISEPI